MKSEITPIMLMSGQALKLGESPAFVEEGVLPFKDFCSGAHFADPQRRRYPTRSKRRRIDMFLNRIVLSGTSLQS